MRGTSPNEFRSQSRVSDEAEEERAARAALRRQLIETHSSTSFEEAELWDLEFWQRRTPQERLSALVALHRDLEKVARAKRFSGD
ncbi:MAG: hypothetical protein DWQ36_02865 [Acidobacteria bacterium]|nr:MAG: hypothetical protein DWQ30_02540 [Acidobacteriota bacterium]REK11068.1 MAG: hypothetical protein DWQ36_02865 [Acidobacteriota bacterium]